MNEIITIQNKIHVILGRLVMLDYDLPAKLVELEQSIGQLKQNIDDCLRDQNDINESTRMQFDSISMSLAELQGREQRQKPRPKIGFITE